MGTSTIQVPVHEGRTKASHTQSGGLELQLPLASGGEAPKPVCPPRLTLPLERAGAGQQCGSERRAGFRQTCYLGRAGISAG